MSSEDGNSLREIALQRILSRSNPNGFSRNSDAGLESTNGVAPKRGMVLPFTPLAMSFDEVNYYVDMPPEMKAQGVQEDRLPLLREVTGAFRPGILTALIGVSGAGKTTMMDVLAERKIGVTLKVILEYQASPRYKKLFLESLVIVNKLISTLLKSLSESP